MQANEAIERLRAALLNIKGQLDETCGRSTYNAYSVIASALAATATIDPPAVTLPDSAPDTSQEWAKLDGVTAWHLIERHADNWSEIGSMMESWLAARSVAAPVLAAVGVEAQQHSDVIPPLRAEPAGAGLLPLPMSSAPHDGTEVLAWSKTGETWHQVYWKTQENGSWAWVPPFPPRWACRWNESYSQGQNDFSYWLPIPAAPDELIAASGCRAQGGNAIRPSTVDDEKACVQWAERYYRNMEWFESTEMSVALNAWLHACAYARAAKGGNTTPEVPAAQPAADHVKLIADALELAHDLALEQQAEIAARFEGYKPEKHAAAARDVALAKEALLAWKARGQQAGVPKSACCNNNCNQGRNCPERK